jgi:capsular exopolysaccharide synthesis family protein
LATTLASASGSCILVDTDLRKPRMHKVFGMASDRGVTNYILSRQPLSDFVRKTEVPGLDLLSCGPLPPNSSEIIHTERFRELVRELEATYENVIFDSPPVEIVSDALVLATLVDGVVLVGHANTSKLESMRSAIRSLQGVSANLLGVVLSRTSTSGSGYGYYYGKGYRRGGRPYRYRYAARPDEETPAMQKEAG